jgi:hypothetical protein
MTGYCCETFHFCEPSSTTTTTTGPPVTDAPPVCADHASGRGSGSGTTTASSGSGTTTTTALPLLQSIELGWTGTVVHALRHACTRGTVPADLCLGAPRAIAQHLVPPHGCTRPYARLVPTVVRFPVVVV